MMMHETKSEYQTIFIVYSSKRPQIMYKSVEKHDMTRPGPRSSYMSLVCMLAGLVQLTQFFKRKWKVVSITRCALTLWDQRDGTMVAAYDYGLCRGKS